MNTSEFYMKHFVSHDISLILPIFSVSPTAFVSLTQDKQLGRRINSGIPGFKTRER